MQPSEGDTEEQKTPKDSPLFAAEEKEKFNMSSSPTLSPTRRFVQFFWACYHYIDTPLESTLQESIELAQFIQSAQCTSFLPRQQQQIRYGLWEMLRDEQTREVSVLELEKQLRLYGGGGLARNSAKRDWALCYAHISKEGMKGSVWNGLSESEEDTLIEALRARGKYHARVPRHAMHCQRRNRHKRNSLSTSLQSSPLLVSSSPFAATVTGTSVKGKTEKSLSSSLSANNVTAVGSDDFSAVLGTIESLTPGCTLCISQGLLQGASVSLHLLQLMNITSFAHICAAPLLVPSDALSTSPREALCMGYHIAQHQLNLAVGFLLSISTQQREEENNNGSIADEEKKHHADIVNVIKSLAMHILEVCVHLLTALRCLEPNNAYIVLLHATVLAFCDRNGISKAKELLRRFIITSALTVTGETAPQGDCDAYDMWIKFESAVVGGGEDALQSDSERNMLFLEQVSTGILFSVYLELLELKQITPMIIYSPSETTKVIAASAAALCLRAREVIDILVQPRLEKLCDAADGAISTRGRQLQSLCWLLRGTVCHILNALSLSPSTAGILLHTFDADAPLVCTREAVKRSDAAQEFVGHPLAPAWMEYVLNKSENGDKKGETLKSDGNKSAAMHISENSDKVTNTTTEYRLYVDSDIDTTNIEAKDEAERIWCEYSARGETSADIISPHERVTEVSLLPPPAMRLWSVLAQTVFRSTSADLVTARARNSEEAEAEAASTMDITTASSIDDSNSNSAEVSSASPSKTMRIKKKSLAAQRENAKKVMDAHRRCEQSSIGFWWRWYETMRRCRLLSFSTDTMQTSLLWRYRQLLTLAAGNNVAPTMFLRALMETYSLMSIDSPVFTAAIHTFPQLSPEAEPSLAAIDIRLREAWQRYDIHCIQPAIATVINSDTATTVEMSTNTKQNKNKTGDFSKERQRRGAPLEVSSLPPLSPLVTTAAAPTRRKPFSPLQQQKRRL